MTVEGGTGVRAGRPRSERARRAVLEAVDDLLVEIGYGAMTMKGIAERAGVGRQTVYRWWSSKAEILLEATVWDARKELSSAAREDPAEDLRGYLEALHAFLTGSDAGLSYRALVGEAQHDADVAEMVRGTDVLDPSAREVLGRTRPRCPAMPDDDLASAQLVGPVLSRILRGTPLTAAQREEHVSCLLRAWGVGR